MSDEISSLQIRGPETQVLIWRTQVDRGEGTPVYRPAIAMASTVLPVGEGVTLIQVWSFDSCIRIDMLTTKLRLYLWPQGITRLYLLACGLFFAWVWTEMSQTQWNNHLGARWRHIPLSEYIWTRKREKERVDIAYTYSNTTSVMLTTHLMDLYTCICLFVYLLLPLHASSFKNWVICRVCSLLYLHFYNISACKGPHSITPFFEHE